MRSLLLAGVVAVAWVGVAKATIIDFDSEGFTGPSFFSAASPAPQTVVVPTVGGNVTFNGGVILNNASNLPADETALYGTASFRSGLVNPITITFTAPITNFLVDVVNGETSPVMYQLSDNQGHSSSFTLASNANSGVTAIGFAASGSIVTIASVTAPTSSFDFFIDNITFNVPLSCTGTGCTTTTVPEPASLALLGMSVLGVAAMRRRRAG